MAHDRRRGIAVKRNVLCASWCLDIVAGTAGALGAGNEEGEVCYVTLKQSA